MRSGYELAPCVVRRGLAAAICFLALILAATYPGYRALAFAIACGGIATSAWRTPWWLATIPVSIVVGDWYPLTGSLLVSESDIFLIGLLGGQLWRTGIAETPPVHPPRSYWVLWAPMLASTLIALIRGWGHLPQALCGDQLSIYSTQWNSLRIAKGFLIGGGLAPFVIAEVSRCAVGARVICLGFKVAAVLVAVSVVIERNMTYGIFELDSIYRPTGTFMSMHVGGQHLDAFWALALPLLFPRRWRDLSRIGCLAHGVLLGIAYYAIAATMSRVIFVWAITVGVTMLAMAVANFRRNPAEIPRRHVGLLLLTSVAIILVLTAIGSAFRNRFESIADDWKVRRSHWQLLRVPVEKNTSTKWLGIGLGTVPNESALVLNRAPRPVELIAGPSATPHLRLRPGKSLFVEQLVDVRAPSPWKLRIDVRSVGAGMLKAHVCEKTLYQSFQCAEAECWINASPQPRRIELPIDVSALQRRLPQPFQRPVTFAISVVGKPLFIDVSNLELTDAAGHSILRNSSFMDGTRFWFLTSDDLQSWHANSLIVQLYVEQGIVGMLSFALLSVGTLAILVTTGLPARDYTSGAIGLSIVGVLVIGVFDSIIDAPGIAQMLYLLIATGQGWALRSNASTCEVQSNLVDDNATRVVR